VPSSWGLGVIRNDLVVMLGVLAATALLAGTAPEAASSSALLYNYEFTGAGGTVVNSAPQGPAASLTLDGAWKPVPEGVHFSGNTAGSWSVAYGKPASGYTIDVPSATGLGFGARFVYRAPVSGKCFSDTPNITQIGRFHEDSTQAKIQLSSCLDSMNNVMVECRFAGSLTSPGTPPVASTLPLVNGNAYNVSCVKSPDKPDKTATITLTVTSLGPVKSGKSVTNTFTVAAIGTMVTTEYLSAGNKYPVPAPANNT